MDKPGVEVAVTVPLWALEFVLENADLCDSGPAGQGWHSDEMDRARDALQAALDVEEARRAAIAKAQGGKVAG